MYPKRSGKQVGHENKHVLPCDYQELTYAIPNRRGCHGALEGAHARISEDSLDLPVLLDPRVFWDHATSDPHPTTGTSQNSSYFGMHHGWTYGSVCLRYVLGYIHSVCLWAGEMTQWLKCVPWKKT